MKQIEGEGIDLSFQLAAICYLQANEVYFSSANTVWIYWCIENMASIGITWGLKYQAYFTLFFMYNFKISKRVVQEKNQTPKNYTNININFKKFIFIDQCFSILTPPFRALYLYFITNSSFIHDS